MQNLSREFGSLFLGEETPHFITNRDYWRCFLTRDQFKLIKQKRMLFLVPFLTLGLGSPD